MLYVVYLNLNVLKIMFNYETSLIQQIALIDICDHGCVVLRGKPEHLESNAV